MERPEAIYQRRLFHNYIPVETPTAASASAGSESLIKAYEEESHALRTANVTALAS